MGAKLTYWGLAAFQVVTEQGTTILMDPALRRNPDAPLAVEDVDRADLILVTHLSWDHLGDAFELAKRTGALLVGGSDTAAYARREGVAKERIRIMSSGGRRVLGEVTVQAVEAHHVSFAETPDGQYISGQPLSFIVMLPSGERIYHTGDTSIFSDMKLLRELYRPNMTTFAIGATPGGGTHIDAYESALACQWLGIEIAIPVHYSDPRDLEEFREHLAKLSPAAKIVPLKPGETYEAQFSRT